METQLRPLTLGEILDRTAQLYRENFLLFAGIAALYAGVVLVLSLMQIGVAEILRAQHVEQSMRWVIWVAMMISMLVAFLFAGAAVAANNRAVGWLHLGQPATIRAAYASVLPRLGRYLWLMTITAFVVYLPLALVYGGYLGVILLYARPKGLIGQPGVPPAAVDSHAAMVFLAVTGVFVLLMIPAVVYATIMGMRYSLAVPACVMEDTKARTSIKRSILLSKGARGRIFLLVLLVLAVDLGMLMLTQMFFVVATIKHHGMLPVWIRILQQVVAFFTNTFVQPILATGLTLFYYDQRVRKEGFDIEWMMRAAGMDTLPAAAGEGATAATTDARPGLGVSLNTSPDTSPGTSPNTSVNTGHGSGADDGSVHE